MKPATVFALIACVMVICDRRIALAALPLNQPMQVHQALFHSGVGPRIGVYFTIERVRNAPERTSRFETVEWTFDLDHIQSIDELVDYLRDQMENREVKVVRSADFPNVIHLIEEPLLVYDDYVMNKRVDVEYAGRLSGLAAALGERVPGIGPRQFGTNTNAFDDHGTRVEINIKDRSVRQILTEAPPLENYKHFLWRAETDLQGTWKDAYGAETFVQFYGTRTARYEALRARYAGIDAHLQGQAALDSARVVSQLMKHWNPVGAERNAVKIVMGRPTEESETSLVYRFGGDDGVTWGFVMDG